MWSSTLGFERGFQRLELLGALGDVGGQFAGGALLVREDGILGGGALGVLLGDAGQGRLLDALTAGRCGCRRLQGGGGGEGFQCVSSHIFYIAVGTGPETLGLWCLSAGRARILGGTS